MGCETWPSLDPLWFRAERRVEPSDMGVVYLYLMKKWKKKGGVSSRLQSLFLRAEQRETREGRKGGDWREAEARDGGEQRRSWSRAEGEDEAQGKARQAKAMGWPFHRSLESRQVRPFLERGRHARSQLILHPLPSIQRSVTFTS